MGRGYYPTKGNIKTAAKLERIAKAVMALSRRGRSENWSL